MSNIKKRSEKRETKIAKEISGRRHVMSGATWSQKGDVSNDLFLIEDKFTDAEKYTLHHSTILKNNKEATRVGKIPVVTIGFEKFKNNYAVIELEYHPDFISILDSIDDCKVIEVKENKKSIVLHDKDLLLLYNSLDSSNYLGLIIFNISGKSSRYLIYDWGLFLKDLNIFIS